VEDGKRKEHKHPGEITRLGKRYPFSQTWGKGVFVKETKNKATWVSPGQSTKRGSCHKVRCPNEPGSKGVGVPGYEKKSE